MKSTHLFRLLWGGLLALALQSSSLHAAAGGAYQLGPGDQVKITVFGHADLSGTFELDSVGRISLPLIKSVDALGLNQMELETVVTNRLRPDYLVNPRVSIEVLNYRPFYIVGEVKNAGDFPYQSGLTILKAIALAGGYSERANTGKVYITRAEDPERRKKVAKPGSRVMPGDIISIPARFF